MKGYRKTTVLAKNLKVGDILADGVHNDTLVVGIRTSFSDSTETCVAFKRPGEYWHNWLKNDRKVTIYRPK